MRSRSKFAATGKIGAWTLVVSLLLASTARAADRRLEAFAKDSIKKASADYLAMSYDKGAARLEKALKLCGGKGCTPTTKAGLLRDLGTMQFREGDVGGAQKSWADALKLDPKVELNPDYDAPDLRTAWEQAKGGPAAEEHPAGDFTHTPAAGQKPNTGLPVYVEYTAGGTLARVIVKYRAQGKNDWSRIELKKLQGNGWGGVIPCGEVTKGPMRYWVQGFDADGGPIASSGDPKHPYTVAIQEDYAGPAPQLPGAPPPQTCGADGEDATEDAECTPGAPGCGKAVPEPAPPPSNEGPAAAGGEPGYARFWVGIAGTVDFVSLPSGDSLCQLNNDREPTNSLGYYCTNPNGTDFPSRTVAPTNNPGGQLNGGIRASNVRLLVSLDYAISQHLLVGTRVGYVLNAYPGEAAVNDGRAFGSRVHLEGRATVLFGHAPLIGVGFRPMAFLGAGVAEFDGHSTSIVTAGAVEQPVAVWLTGGPFFVTAGAGVRYQFSSRVAFMVAARGNGAFGGNGFLFTFGPEVSVAYGF